jgi:hypothetical protein
LTGVTVAYERPAALQAGDEVPDSWEVRASNPGTENASVIVTVICVAARGLVTSDSPTLTEERGEAR